MCNSITPMKIFGMTVISFDISSHICTTNSPVGLRWISPLIPSPKGGMRPWATMEMKLFRKEAVSMG